MSVCGHTPFVWRTAERTRRRPQKRTRVGTWSAYSNVKPRRLVVGHERRRHPQSLDPKTIEMHSERFNCNGYAVEETRGGKKQHVYRRFHFNLGIGLIFSIVSNRLDNDQWTLTSKKYAVNFFFYCSLNKHILFDPYPRYLVDFQSFIVNVRDVLIFFFFFAFLKYL